MPLAELIGDRIEVATDYADKNLIQQVPGARWDAERRTWHAPLSWGSCQVLRGVFGDRLQVGELLSKWVWEQRRTWIEPCLTLRGEQVWPLGGTDLDERLFPHQVAGAHFLAMARQALLGDEPGTGKTATARSAVRLLDLHGQDPYPVCVICPNSMKATWAREWVEWEWLDDGDQVDNIFVVTGSAARRKKLLAEAEAAERAVVIINWEAVRMHSRLAPYGSVRLRRCELHGGDVGVKVAQCESHLKELNTLQFRTVIADEAHKQKDPKSKQTRAVWAVQHGDEVRHRFSLTGTPVANHPGDLWGLLHGLSPVDWPSKTRFVDRYAQLAFNTFGGMDIIGVRPDTRDELFRVLDPRFRRMTKKLVLPSLPPKLRQQRVVELGAKQARAYKELEKGMVTRLDDGSLIITTNSMTQSLRLLQFSSSYAEIDEATGRVVLSKPSPKIDELVEVLEELTPKPLVVCAESRQLIMLAAQRLDELKISYRLIVGDMTTDQRDNALADFQAGRARVMLFTIKAGGVGLTMTRADTILFLQRSWSMLENKQAEDRVHRIGSEVHESITVIDLLAPGTVEETQLGSLGLKLQRLEEITRDRQALLQAGKREAVALLDLEEQQILASSLLTESTEMTPDDGEDDV